MDNQFLDEGLLFKPAEAVELELASQSKRFGTYIIDRILCYGVTIALVAAYIAADGDALERIDADSGTTKVLDVLLSYFSLVVYYAFFEIVAQGRTIGKMICGTRALTTDGDIMDAGTVLKRTLCRVVPFDALSFLGGEGTRGWHDRWSDTMVVNENSYQNSLR